MSFLDARARFENDFFAGLTEAVRESFTSFTDQLEQLNKAEREAGRPETSYVSLVKPVATVEPVKPKPEGFGHRETEMSVAETKKQFGYLLKLRADVRLREVVRIYREFPEVNKAHVSRVLGKSPSWMARMFYEARGKGLV